jgi:hypothetical protein
MILCDTGMFARNGYFDTSKAERDRAWILFEERDGPFGYNAGFITDTKTVIPYL